MNDQPKGTSSASPQPPNERPAMQRITDMNARFNPQMSPCGFPTPIGGDMYSQPGNVPSASPQPQALRPLLKHMNDTLKVHELLPAYTEALSNYLTTVSSPPPPAPPCLANPLACFYSRKGKNHADHIFFFQPFPYGKWVTTKVSKRTFPAFLRSCAIPDGPPHLRDALFDALQKLIRDYPYNEREVLMKELIRTDLPYAQFLCQNIVVSSENNLFFLADVRNPAFHKSVFAFVPILSPYFPAPQSASRSVVKRYLSCVVRCPNQQDDQPQRELSFSAKSILFYGSVPDRKFQSLSYEGKFVTSDLPELLFPVKALPYLEAPTQVPSGAASWLFHLTGGDIGQADLLAELLARAASPALNERNMTVVCTRENPEVLQTLLKEVLSSLILTSGPKPSKRTGVSLPSLNQFCRASGLMQLYSAQGMGQGVAFVRDIDVSDTARPVLNKLLLGKPVTLSTPHLPKQHLYNKTHFICISQDPQKARKLSQSLKVRLIDLSSSEIPLHNPQELSSKDIAWLRSVFLPYGLAEHKKAAPPEKAPPPSDWVCEFLSKFCSVEPDSKCHRETLYNAYAACYRHTHPGLEPPLTQGRFVKAVKPYLGKGDFRHVSYRKIRREQKMYFVGLTCPAELPAPAPTPDEAHTDAFTAHLKTIHSLCPRFSLKQDVQARVSLPSDQ